jgi:hypothetical protein
MYCNRQISKAGRSGCAAATSTPAAAAGPAMRSQSVSVCGRRCSMGMMWPPPPQRAALLLLWALLLPCILPQPSVGPTPGMGNIVAVAHNGATVAGGATVLHARRHPASTANSNGTGFIFGGETANSSLSAAFWAHGSGAWAALPSCVAGADAPGVYNGGSWAAGGGVTLLPRPCPGARAGASMVVLGGDLLLFGGYGYGNGGAGGAAGSSSRGYLNDLWLFDGSAWTWWGGSDMPNQLPCLEGSGCTRHSCPDWFGQGQQRRGAGPGGQAFPRVHSSGPCSWPGGRRSAASWQDETVRTSDRHFAMNNSNFEAPIDKVLMGSMGFAYTSPTGWVAGARGQIYVVSNGIFRWGSARSALNGGSFVALVDQQASVSQLISGLTVNATYRLEFRAASGFSDGDEMRVLVDGVPGWVGRPPDDAFQTFMFEFLCERDTVSLVLENVSPSQGAAVFVDDIVLMRAHVRSPCYCDHQHARICD